MQTFQTGSRGLRFLVDLNWDRGLYLGAMVAVLLLGLFLCSIEVGVLSSK